MCSMRSRGQIRGHKSKLTIMLRYRWEQYYGVCRTLDDAEGTLYHQRDLALSLQVLMDDMSYPRYPMPRISGKCSSQRTAAAKKRYCSFKRCISMPDLRQSNSRVAASIVDWTRQLPEVCKASHTAVSGLST